MRTAVKGLSYLINFDDTEELSRDLQKDELVKRELSLISEQLVLRGGRLVSIGSALFHVIRHIDFSSDKRGTGQNLEQILEQSLEQSHEQRPEQRPEQSHEKSPDIGVDEHTPPAEDEQITKPESATKTTKASTKKPKDPKKVAAGKKLAEHSRIERQALNRVLKRESEAKAEAKAEQKRKRKLEIQIHGFQILHSQLLYLLSALV